MDKAPAPDDAVRAGPRDDVALIETTTERWGQVDVDDLDLSAMRTFMLIARLTSLARARIEDDFARHHLTTGEFDVLAALFLSADGRLTPTALAQVAMVSGAGMTNRVDRLEQAGHVRREADDNDRRRRLVAITDSGRSLVVRSAPDHTALERSILAPLSESEQRDLDDLVITLLAGPALAPDGSR